MFETLIMERKGHVCLVRMNRPAVLNALNQQAWRDLVGVFGWLKSQGEIRAAVLTGEGRAFCVGADVKETAWKDETVSQSRRRIEGNQQQLTREIVGLPVPVIAAVNGYALGGGVEIALACDIRIAADDAVFGFPEAALGLFLSGGATSLLPRLIGLGRAKMLVYTGRRIDAATAERVGLVEEVAPRAELLARALALAESISENAPVSIALVKRALDRAALGDLETALAIETEGLLAAYATADHIEGPKAFAEKRKPRFVGH